MVQFYAMGGNIDKDVDGQTDGMKMPETSAIPDYLKHLGILAANEGRPVNPEGYAAFQQVVLLDSSAIQNHHREDLVERISRSQSSRHVVTHGLNTIYQTARYLQERLGEEHTVVLMGADEPLRRLAGSDAGFELGSTTAFARTFGPGVYISFRGEVGKIENIDPDKPIKDGRLNFRAT